MRQPSTILFIHHGSGLGGAPLSLLYLVQTLDRTRYNPIVAFLHQSEAIKLFTDQQIPVQGPLNVYDFSHTKIWWFRWYHPHYILRSIKDTLKTMFWVAPRVYQEQKPTIVHLNTSSLIGWGYAAWRRNIPVVWHIREPLAPGYFGLRRKLIQWCVRTFATKIIAISAHDAQPWTKLTKTQVLHNIVPATKFNPTINPAHIIKQYQLDPARPRILFLGGLSLEKGTLTILQALELLVKKLPNVQLIIAGHVPPRPINPSILHQLKPASAFAAQVHTYLEQLAPNIILVGPVHTIPELMAASNVIVFPATVGHFARPIIEAGFMQKPVIASRLAPLDELVIDQITGFLVDPLSPSAWAAKLFELLSNPALQEKMGLAGHTWCTEQFNTTTYSVKIAQLYANIQEKL